MPKHRESPTARVNPSAKKVWVARYTGPDGRRRSAGTLKTKREAQDAIDTAHGRPAARETVGQYAHDWTARYPRSERTDKTNRGRLAAVLDLKVEGRPLQAWPFAELRRRHAGELVDRMLRDQGRAATGAANILRTVSAMAEDAITDELIGANPFKGVRVRRSDPRAGRASRRPRVLSWAQMHEFAAATGVHEPMVRMLGDCGLRVGELFALTRELQDLRDGVFTVLGSGWEGSSSTALRPRSTTGRGRSRPAASRSYATCRCESTRRGCSPPRPAACGGSTTSTVTCGARPAAPRGSSAPRRTFATATSPT